MAIDFIESGSRIATENFRLGKFYTITFTDSSSTNCCCTGIGYDSVVFQRELPELLFTLNLTSAAMVSTIELYAGSGGSTDYDDLSNKPQINGVTLSGNKTSSDLGLQSTISDLATIRSGASAGATAVQPAALETALAAKQDTISDLETIRSGASAGATAVQPAAMQTALAVKQDTIDSSHKLSADLVDDTNTTNKFATAAQLEQIATNENNILTINAELIELVDNGAKNKICVDRINTTNANGVTYTINNDGTITANGTPSGTSPSYVVAATLDGSTYKNFAEYCNGDNVLSGCPSGGSSSTYRMYITGTGYTREDFGNGVELTDTSVSPLYLIIYIYNGYTADNLTFKPMICSKSAWDISQKYVPYVPTNAELYEMIQALQP